MKVLLTLIIIGLIGFGAWLIWGDQIRDELAENEIDITPDVALEEEDFGNLGIGEETDVTVEEELRLEPAQTSAVVPRTTPRIVTPTPLTTAPLFFSIREMNSSNEGGIVSIFSDANGRAVVAFNLVGAPPGVRQPAYIYEGSCAGRGGVVFTLNPLLNGASSTTLGVSVSELFRSRASLAIFISKSLDEPIHQFACGEIK